MKALKYILIIISFFNVLIVKAEFFPTFSIVELSILADTVVEARFLKKENETYAFRINRINQDEKYDTLYLSMINRLFNEDQKYHSSFNFEQRIKIESCDKMLIYLTKDPSGKRVEVWSGYRLLKDDLIYLPVQPDNPGKFSFMPSKDSIAWDELISRVQIVHTRIQQVKRIKNIQDPQKRNQALFNWINNNRNSFGKDCSLNEDCGWGSIEWEVFTWITEGNISHDTWKASQLYRDINSKSPNKWRRKARILRDANGNSFNSYHDIDYLLNISLDSTRTIYERNQALIYLRKASTKVYENNYPIPHSTTLELQTRKQISIRDGLLPLLNDIDLREQAFQIISIMSNPMSGAMKHRIELSLLPVIKKYYNKEIPSRFKSDLARFIVHNSSVKEWKDFSDCDAQIFVDLYQVRIDTSTNLLSFGINYEHGKETINNEPVIQIISENTMSEKTFKTTSNFKLPYQNWEGVRYLKIDISNLELGKYRVFVSGEAGEKSEYKWKSEYGEFKIK